MSQMEREAQESPEPSGCLPAAPLQPEWKSRQSQRSARLLGPRARQGSLLGRRGQKCSR